MADLQAIYEFGNVQYPLGCTVTLSHGITPSQFVLRCLPQEKTLWTQSDLRLRFGSTYIRFQYCLADEASFEYDENGQTVAMTVLDRRWKWRGPTISGHYNMRGPDGTFLIVPLGVAASDDPKGDSDYALSDGQRSPRELIEYCLKALGETKYHIDAPGGMYPEMHWEEDNAAQALQQVCDAVGCRVVLKLDNTIAVVQQGKGSDLPAGYVEQYGQLIDPADMPSKLRFVFEPSWYQIDLPLRAVGMKDNGGVTIIDALPYIPFRPSDGGWGKTDGVEFDLIEGEVDRELARKTVFRWYQVDYNASFKSLYIDNLPYNRADGHSWVSDYLAFANQFDVMGVQVFTTKVLGQVQHRPAIVYGDWYDEEANENTSVLSEILNSKDYKLTKTIIPFGFDIDDKQKIVKIDRPMWLRKSTTDAAGIKEAKLSLRTAIQVRDKTTGEYARFDAIRDLAPPANNVGQAPAQWTRTIYVQGLRAYYESTKGDAYSPSNVKELNEYVDKLKAEVDRSYRHQLGETARYSGWLAVSPDGALQSITWQLDESGASTTIHRNNDPGSETTLSYAMRRLNEQFVIAANAAVQMDQQRKYPRTQDGRFGGELPPMRGGGLG